MSSNSGSSSRVSIPNSARRLIQNIKEFAGNHSDEDVYAMLKECSMDPNETAQRLLFLDTFHEVKRKRDKKKEIINSRNFEEPRRKPGSQGRGSRVGRGGYSTQSTHDAGGGKNLSARKENGLEENREKDLKPSLVQPVSKEVDVKEVPSLLKEPPVIENGSIKVPAGGATEQISEVVPAPREDKNHQISAAASASAVVETELVGSLESPSQTQEYHYTLADKVEKEVVTSEPVISEEKIQLPADPVPVSSATVKSNLLQTIGPSKAEEDTRSKLDMLKSSDVQHVIIPNHIQVPDAIKCVLSFGTLDINCGVKAAKENNDKSNQNSNNASESLEDGATKEESSRELDPLPASHEDESSSISPQAALHSPETTEKKTAAPKEDQLKQDTLSAAGPPYPVVQTPSNYNFGLVPPMIGTTVIPIEGIEHQARLSSSVGGNSLPTPSPTPTPPPTQSVGPGQSSVAVSAQHLPLYRQAYSPNYIPFNPYFSPIYMPPPLHQFYGPGGFPQQLQASNVFMPPPPPPGAAQVGMKVSPSHFKGTGPPPNQTNQVPPVGSPSPGYGVLGSSQVGYGHSGAVTSGTSNANEDLMASALKENNMYLGQQSEGSGMWISVPGRESTNIPINSFFNLPLPPQGQHIATIAPPQPGLGAFPFYHHPLQAMAAASPTSAGAHPLLHQQSQSLAGPPQLQAESVVGGPSPPPPPSNGYQPQAQQSQRQPINWNNGF